jgi:hypothetical protein
MKQTEIARDHKIVPSRRGSTLMQDRMRMLLEIVDDQQRTAKDLALMIGDPSSVGTSQALQILRADGKITYHQPNKKTKQGTWSRSTQPNELVRIEREIEGVQMCFTIRELTELRYREIRVTSTDRTSYSTKCLATETPEQAIERIMPTVRRLYRLSLTA